MTSKITSRELELAQKSWADGLILIGESYAKNEDYKSLASSIIDELYGYNFGDGKVLFKPTKAKSSPFRPTKKGALSYFVGGDEAFSEDKGFALSRWSKIDFKNHQIFDDGDIVIAMGEYDFTDSAGSVVTVEYTFGYKINEDGKVKIILHHSSIPFCG